MRTYLVFYIIPVDEAGPVTHGYPIEAEDEAKAREELIELEPYAIVALTILSDTDVN